MMNIFKNLCFTCTFFLLLEGSLYAKNVDLLFLGNKVKINIPNAEASFTYVPSTGPFGRVAECKATILNRDGKFNNQILVNKTKYFDKGFIGLSPSECHNGSNTFEKPLSEITYYYVLQNAEFINDFIVIKISPSNIQAFSYVDRIGSGFTTYVTENLELIGASGLTTKFFESNFIQLPIKY